VSHRMKHNVELVGIHVYYVTRLLHVGDARSRDVFSRSARRNDLTIGGLPSPLRTWDRPRWRYVQRSPRLD
jgi:hypothetical protein